MRSAWKKATAAALLAAGCAAGPVTWADAPATEPASQPAVVLPPELQRVVELCKAGEAALEKGDIAAALAKYQGALEQCRKYYGNRDNADMVLTLSLVGYCLRGMERYSEALPVLQEALAMSRRIDGQQDSRDLATLLTITAICKQNVDKEAEALPLFREALAMDRRLMQGQDDPDMVEKLSNLAACFADLGKLAEALPLYQEALAMDRRLAHAQDQADMVEKLGSTATCLRMLGRYSDALPLFQEALAMDGRLTHGQDGLDRVALLSGAGTCLLNLGKVGDALPMYQQALDMETRLTQGQDRLQMVEELSNLGSCLQALGRYGGALPLFRDALAMARRLEADDNRNVAACLSNLAGCLDLVGRDEEALRLYEDSLAMQRRLHAEQDDPEIAIELNNEANCLIRLGRAGDALPMLEDALAMQKRLFQGRDDSAEAACLNMKGYCLDLLGRSEEALTLYKASLEMRQRLADGRDDPAVALSLNNVGGCYQDLGRFDEALAVLRQGLAMQRRLYHGQDHPDIAMILHNIGWCLDDLDRMDEAVASFQEALAMRERLYPGLDTPDVARSLCALAGCLKDGQRPWDALPLFAQGVAMAERLKDPSLFRYATDLGKLQLSLGQAKSAVNSFSIAITALQDARVTLGGDDEDRMQFMSSVKDFDPYGGMVRAELELNQPGAAAEFLDGGRAQSLLDILERGERISGGDILQPSEEKAKRTGDAAALKRIAEVRSRLAAAEDNVQLLTSEINRARALNSDEGLSQIKQLQPKLDEAYQEYANARRAEFSMAGGTTFTERARAQEIQAMLKPHQHLLMYSITDSDAVLLVVPPPGEKIAGVYLTEADGTTRISGQKLKDLIREYRRTVIQHGIDSIRGVRRVPATRPATRPAGDMAQEGSELFQDLMPPAVWQEIQKDDLVYVAPDVAMSGMPLESLILNARDHVYWIDDGPPICYEPSAGALLELRRQEPDRTGKTYLHEAVLLGDPVLQRDKEKDLVARPTKGAMVTDVKPGSAAERIGLRAGAIILAYGAIEIDGKDDFGAAADKLELLLAHRKLPETPKLKFWLDGQVIEAELAVDSAEIGTDISLGDVTSMDLVMRDATLTRFGALAPLPGTREEVKGIYKVLTGKDYAPATDDSVVVLLGDDATNSRLMEEARGTRYLHLATHGLVMTGQNAPYSSVVLSQPKVVTPQNTGVLTLEDLFDHWWGRLDGTELVVLSACDSQGLDESGGNATSSEGVFGLPWGFMYAGSPAVVASLWEVQDASTAKLMEGFYGDLKSQDREDKLAAFTAARKQLKQKYPEPFFWAPFIYLGDPN